MIFPIIVTSAHIKTPDNRLRSIRLVQIKCDIYLSEGRLRWAGHVIRQDDDDLSRRVLLSEPGGKRPRGRPKLRWEDGMKEDAAKLGSRNWAVVALNREGWRKILKQAEAHPGL